MCALWYCYSGHCSKVLKVQYFGYYLVCELWYCYSGHCGTLSVLKVQYFGYFLVCELWYWLQLPLRYIIGSKSPVFRVFFGVRALVLLQLLLRYIIGSKSHSCFWCASSGIVTVATAVHYQYFLVCELWYCTAARAFRCPEARYFVSFLVSPEVGFRGFCFK